MRHAGVAASRFTALSSLQRTCCGMQLTDCPQLTPRPPTLGIRCGTHTEAATSLGSW